MTLKFVLKYLELMLLFIFLLCLEGWLEYKSCEFWKFGGASLLEKIPYYTDAVIVPLTSKGCCEIQKDRY